MDEPSVLAGTYVVAVAYVGPSVGFEQRRTLNVNGEWLGRVPRLALCQDFDTSEFLVQHCSEAWEPLGVAAGYKSAEQAKEATALSYHGLMWVGATIGREEAHAIYQAELKNEACSFCGRTPLQVQSMAGSTVRICNICVDAFHRAMHSFGSEPN